MSASAPPLRRLFHYARRHRRRIRAATTFSTLNKIFDIAPPLLIGVAVDVVVERDDSLLATWGIETLQAQLWSLAGLTLVIWMLESLFEYLHGVWWRNLAQTIQHELRIDAYSHVQRLELAYFEDQSSGELMSILNDDVNQLERFLDIGANEIIQVSTTVISIGTIFFILAPSIAWLAFLPIPIILWGSFRFQRRIAPRYADVREKVGELNSRLANNLGGITTIKSFTREAYEADRVADDSTSYQASNRRAIRLSSAFSPLIRMAIVIGFTFTLVFGGLQVGEGRLDVGAYSVMVFLTQRLLWPLTRLGETFDLYQRAMASTNRILDLLDLEPKIESGTQELPATGVAGHIEFDRVTFHYRRGTPVLEAVDIDIAPGETTAFVGPTGSGKTTIVKLLLRLYDVVGGSIRLDGHDLRDLRTDDLRRAVGLVSQDVFLFHGTVVENIAYGRPGAGRDEIVAAARAAEAHDFIVDLPDGYETVVGERGQKLSGGQRQRISIARAVLKDPPIFIFDEATSAVDNETEAAIQRSIERLSVDRTTIVIAHRLSTIRNAERIYVIDSGRVVEAGTHRELVDHDGIYRSLWLVQTGEAVEHHRHTG